MGIVNLTPDSFFKESRIKNINDFKKKVAYFNELNVDLIDVGGESTRPGSIKISEKDEYLRIKKYLTCLSNLNLNIKTSLDSRNYETIKKCLNLRLSMINDISGLSDHRLIKLINQNKICVVIMHMQNHPENMQMNPNYNFAPIDIYEYFKNKIDVLTKLGINSSQIIIDPGFGFGKNLNHNLSLMKYLPIFHSFGLPILVGLSRKSLIKEISKLKFAGKGALNSPFSPKDRLCGSLSLELNAYNKGVQIIRSHDIFNTMQSVYCSEEVDINNAKV